MTGKFGIQINPELILKLTDPDKYQRQNSVDLFQKPQRPRRPVAKPEPLKPSQPLAAPEASPSPAPPVSSKPETLPSPPLWHGPAFFTPDRREEDALAPYRKVAAECERAVESLQKAEEKEREEVQRRVKELQSKQYRAPEPKRFPCPDEQTACISCLTENRDNPLKCQDSIKAYSLCAGQVRQRFVRDGFSSPKVNT
eukprot:c11039_g1_i1 orf=103-696(+)